MTGGVGASREALEDIAYLARSENRVRILRTLTQSAYPRHDLEEVTGTSRTTLGRILGEFEGRGWAERTVDGTYTATPRGAHIVAAFDPLHGAMETVHSLGEAVALLPTDELSIGLHHFSDATVRRPAPNEPAEAGRGMADLLADASQFRTLTFIAPPVPVGEAMADGVLGGHLAAEHVLAGGLVPYLRDHPRGPPPWRAYLEAGACVYEYDGHIPCNLFVIDETVLVGNAGAEGTDPTALIESRNQAVRTWAHELIDRYCEDATEVEAESFPPQ